MTRRLVRFQQSGQTHFITFSCYRRQPILRDGRVCAVFVDCLERMRRHYRFRVYGYVLMPEHVHLLVSEPQVATLSKVIQALNVSVVRNVEKFGAEQDRTLWQKRYYDHNVRDHRSFVGKLRYIHRNPVKRGLCSSALDWKWSSFRHYATAAADVVEIESQWTADRRVGRTPSLLGSSGS